MFFRQVGIGAAAVLAAGLLAAGCSDEGDTIIMGGSGSDLSINDVFPGRSIADASLATDGAGLSPNNASIQSVKIVFAADSPTSDGTFAGDNSAMIVFKVKTGTDYLWYACHYIGGSLTPPVLLTPADYDPTDNAGVSADAVVCLFLGTSGFAPTDSTGLPIGAAGDLAAVRAQHGNWLILLPGYAGYYEDPRLQLTQDYNSGDQPTGKHFTFWSFIFKNAWRGIPSLVVDNTAYRVNGDPASTEAYYVGVEFQYGFQVEGLDEIPTARNGLCKPHARYTNAGDTPAADVQSFGLISDGFNSQAAFKGDGAPINETSGIAVPVTDTGNAGEEWSAAYSCGEAVNFVHLFYTQVVTSLNSGPSWADATRYQSSIATGFAPTGARLAAFEAAFDLKTLKFGTPALFQPIVSRTADWFATGASPGTAFYPTFHTYNQFCFYRYADVSLHDPRDVTASGSANGAWIANGFSLGQQWDNGGSGKATYSYHMGTDADNSADKDLVDGGYVEKIIGKFHVVDSNGDGDCGDTGEVAGKMDLSLQNTGATTPTHSQPTIYPDWRHLWATNARIDETPKREIMTFNDVGSISDSQPLDGQFIFGLDESLYEQVIFYTWADNTTAGGLDDDATATGPKKGNIYRQLIGASFDWEGNLIAGGAAFKNPRMISTTAYNHAETFAGGYRTENRDWLDYLHDPLINTGDNGPQYFTATMNRKGTYVLLSYLQPAGDTGGCTRANVDGDPANSSDYREQNQVTATATWYLALKSAVYATTRFDPAFTKFTQIDRTLDAYTAPQIVSANNSDTDYVQMSNLNGTMPESDDRQSYLKVNGYMHQMGVCYRAGLQSDPNVIWNLWEQSDDSCDRLFVRQITVTPGTFFGATPAAPSFALGSDWVEVEEGQTVDTTAVNTSGSNQTGGAVRAQASRNLDATWTIPNHGIERPMLLDLGQTNSQVAAGSAAQGGAVLVTYAKCTDNSDGTAPATGAGSSLVGTQPTTGKNARNVQLIAGWIARDGVAFQERTSNFGLVNFHEDLPYKATHGAAGGLNDTPSLGDTAHVAVDPPGPDTEVNLVEDAAHSVMGGLFTPHNTDIVGGTLNQGGHQADAIYLYLRAPYGNGSHGLYTRKIDLAKFRATSGSTAFADAVIPPVTKDPTRIEHGDSQDVSNVNTEVQVGASTVVIFQQDSHIWAQPTGDGVNYTMTGTLPSPQLADNDSSEDVMFWNVEMAPNAQGDTIDALLYYWKLDEDDDTRLRMRMQVHP